MTMTAVPYDSPSITVHEVGQLTGLPSNHASIAVHPEEERTLDLLGVYLDEISRVLPLTQEQERLLVAQVRAGDESARHRLIEAHLSLVVPIARRYAHKWGSNVMELISAGNLGLTLAATACTGSGDRCFAVEATCRIIEAISLSIANEREASMLTSSRKEEDSL